MLIPKVDEAWQGIIDESWIDELDNTNFLTRCRKGEVTRSELEGFIVEQYHYSKNFTRYLCALMSNLHHKEDIEALAENLCEEMGLTDEHTKPHSKIYSEMMQKLKIDHQAKPLQTTQNLIDAMFSYCRNNDPVYGLAALCLGAEAIVPHLYAQILRGFEAIGQPMEDLYFFSLHVECDDGHAITMKNIIMKYLAEDKQKLELVKAIGKKMIQHRIDFLNGISLAYIHEEAA